MSTPGTASNSEARKRNQPTMSACHCPVCGNACVTQHAEAIEQARAEGLAVAEHLLRKIVDYWDGRPLTHHGDHIYADLADTLRAITPAAALGDPR